MLFLNDTVHESKSEKKYDIYLTDTLFGMDEKRKIIGALSGLRQFLATESPLKVMKNVFYFALKTLYILKIFTFLS